jgi:hypothetical protein
LGADAAFPFILDGDQYDAMESGRPTRVDHVSLLYGILLTFGEPSTFVETATPTQLREALDDLVLMLRAASLEFLLLDAGSESPTETWRASRPRCARNRSGTSSPERAYS